jgi:hypothetical protein
MRLNMLNLLVAEPAPGVRRILAGGEVLRQEEVVNVGRLIESKKKKEERLMRKSTSPGT